MPGTPEHVTLTKKPARTPQCPSLPPEIWVRILTFHTDLTHLWTCCQHVSHSFRAYTEYIFSHDVIRNTYIDFHLEKHNLGGKSKRPEIPTSFSHFSPDTPNRPKPKHHAYFTDKRPKRTISNGNASEYKKLMTRWESNVQTYKPQMPNYTIRIATATSTLVNDTALPDLGIDIAQRRVHFDWRAMFTLFFREQALFAQLQRTWSAATDTLIATNNARIARNEKLSIADYPQPWPAAELELRKQIRRKRLLETHAASPQMVWAVRSLAHFENHGADGGSARAFKLNPHVPGAGVGERWFGCVSLVQELYLDEWSCMHRIDTKAEHCKAEGALRA